MKIARATRLKIQASTGTESKTFAGNITVQLVKTRQQFLPGRYIPQQVGESTHSTCLGKSKMQVPSTGSMERLGGFRLIKVKKQAAAEARVELFAVRNIVRRTLARRHPRYVFVLPCCGMCNVDAAR